MLAVRASDVGRLGKVGVGEVPREGPPSAMNRPGRDLVARLAPRPECAAQRLLPDGRELCVYVRPYNSILTVGPNGAPIYDDQW